MQSVRIGFLIFGFLAQQSQCCCGEFLSAPTSFEVVKADCVDAHEDRVRQTNSCPCSHRDSKDESSDDEKQDDQEDHEHHRCFGTHVFAMMAQSAQSAIDWVFSAAFSAVAIHECGTDFVLVPATLDRFEQLAPTPTLPLRAALHIYLF